MAAADRTDGPPIARGKHRFELIEAARGLAALVVVFHHAGNQLALPRYADGHIWGGHLSNFNVGVDFFFVLSGFIITWVHWNDLGQPARLGNYVSRRFFRVFPPYWGILFPLIVFYLLIPSAGRPEEHDPINMLLSIPLMPYVHHPVIGVAWTLTFEMFFYVLFAGMIYAGRKALWLLLPWAALIVAASAFTLPYPLAFLLSPYNLEFIAGVGAAALLRRHEIPFPALAMAGGAILFLGLMLFAVDIQDDMLRARLAFGASATMFVLGAVEFERRRPVQVPAAARLLGAASYSLYLVHSIAIAIAIAILWRLGAARWPGTVSVLLLVAAALVAGIAYHRLAEPMLTAALRRLVSVPRLRMSRL